jgi:hypothetical protein
MTKRARPPSPLPSVVTIAALLAPAGLARTAEAAAPDASTRRDASTNRDASTAEDYRGTVVIVCRIDGKECPMAALTIDGAPVPLDGRPLELPVGHHDFVVEIEGGEQHREQILVTAWDQNRVLTFDLRSRIHEHLGGPPVQVSRGGCCGHTAEAAALRDLRGASAMMVLAAALAARRRKERDE